jgi:hypothetical protein
MEGFFKIEKVHQSNALNKNSIVGKSLEEIV